MTTSAKPLLLAGFLCLGVLFARHATAQQSTPKTGEAQRLLAQTSAKLGFDRARPYRLRARVVVYSDPRTEPGQYSFINLGERGTRTEMKLPGYEHKEIRLGTLPKTSYYYYRNADYEPLVALHAREAANLHWFLLQTEWAEFVRKRKVAGRSLTCVEGAKPRGASLCLGDDGLPFSYNTPVMSAQFSDYTSFGDKTYPLRITVFIDKEPILVITVENIENLTEDDSLLAVPTGWERFPDCSKVGQGRAISQPKPNPVGDLAGKVVMWATINREGVLRGLTVIKSSGSTALDAEAMRAVQNWRYEPYRCGDTPVPVETTIVVNFER